MKQNAILKPVSVSQRVRSVDIVRGLMILLMALDHVRTFWFNGSSSPLDLTHTTLALFITRWVTHLCAPLFFLLAGVSIYFSLSRGKSKREMTKYLLVRGILLIIIEITIFSKLWIGEDGVVLLQVLWALGCAMIAMSGLIWLNKWMIGLFSFSQVIGHHLLQDTMSGIWTILHVAHSNFRIFDTDIIVLYPLIPWLGVMGLGYLIGPIWAREVKVRIKWFTTLGTMSLTAFVLLRYSNLYGDPSPWRVYGSGIQTVLSFINCEKYPPSLQFLLLTLGIGFLILGFVEWLVLKKEVPLLKLIELFGKVPMFFYLIHVPFILALKFSLGVEGVNLALVYGIWGITIVALFPICKGFQHLKGTEKWSFLHYI